MYSGNHDKERNHAAGFTAVLSIILFLFVFPLLTGATEAAVVKVTIHFDSPRTVEDDNGFTRILFPRTIQAGRPGEPSFPFRAVHLLLPPGERVKKASITRKSMVLIGKGYRLYPFQHMEPGLEEPTKEKPFIINRAVYAGTEWINPPYSFNTGYLRGHAIAIGAVSPVSYQPAGGAVGYYREIEVTVETEPSPMSNDALRLLRTDPATERRIKALVENPGLLESYATLSASSGCNNDYEYLIVTPEEFIPYFEPLKNFYTRRGIRTSIITVEYIEVNYSGIDTAEKIRNAIIDEYVNHHIDFVLLGGDADGAPGTPMPVPYRGLYCGVQSSSFYEDDNIPADIYYAALDGDWNSDADLLWGEPGEEDFYSEIAVGRACVDTPDEVTTFVNKTISYQSSPVTQDERKATLFGEKLWSDPLTYGGDEMDQLVGTCTAYGFTTTGIPEDFDITKYYDRDLGSWDKTTVFSAINSGTNWVAHSGHSNWQYVMRLYLSDVTDDNFTNDGVNENFPIIYSYGCYAASFDNRTTDSYGYLSADCIVEEFMTIQHGAAAFLGNSRYGWFTEGTTNGPSHHLQREFYDAIFTEGITRLGEANQRSKDETVPFIDLPDEYEPGAHRWCFYTLNLIGDPVLDGWTDTPVYITVNHPPAIGRNDSVLYIETDAPFARASCYWNGTSFGVGTADPTGRVIVNLCSPLPDTLDSMELVITAHDRYEYADTIQVLESTDARELVPAFVLEQNIPNPFNPSTIIRFKVEKFCHVTLTIYDVTGRKVTNLVDEYKKPGSYSISWRPENLASGVYFYTLRAGDRITTKKAVLLK